jgi:hypothetical protein
MFPIFLVDELFELKYLLCDLFLDVFLNTIETLLDWQDRLDYRVLPRPHIDGTEQMEGHWLFLFCLVTGVGLPWAAAPHLTVLFRFGTGFQCGDCVFVLLDLGA